MILTHNIDPVILSIGSINFYWYGAMYAISFLLIDYMMRKDYFLNSVEINKSQIDSLLVISILSVIVGGRLGYVLFYNFDYYLMFPHKILFIWEGGMSFHGALLMMIFALMYYSYKNNLETLILSDYLVIFAPIGLFLGRIGNFINSELYGLPTNSNWGIVFPRIDNVARHPSMLYEAFLEGALLYLIMLYFFAKRRGNGFLTGIFLVFYSLFRFIIEFVRVPDEHIGYLWDDWFTMGQLLSLPMFVIGMYIILRKKEKII